MARTAADGDSPWLVGCASADITGEPWGVGLMGYGMRFQRSTGIQLRQRSRAFVVADRESQQRVAFVVADIGMFFRNVRDAVLAHLDGTRFGDDNVALTATHTHAGVAGYSCYRLYNMTTDGFRPRTFQAIVDGVVASIEQAEADLAPARLVLSRGALHDASVNRSPQAFARNADDDRAQFPAGIDPTTTLLRFERGGRTIGAINWFATHGTSLTNRNTLISGDNKGYAAYRWEQEEPRLVAAFAQTNAGDMSPNVPDATQGPTHDEIENARIIGQRQYDAARGLEESRGRELTGGLDCRLARVDLSRRRVSAEFSGDGAEHRTGRAVLGAAFAAGTKEGPGVGWCHEGAEANRVLSMCSGSAYRIGRRLGEAQRPKAMLLPVGLLRWTADVLPIQLVRIGELVLVALAQEVTIVAGLRLRRAVAAALDVDADNVLVQGYANDYAGYVTTPEEYDAQRYEGGHTMFGRWQLPAYLQEVTRIATDMRDRRPSESAEVRAVAAPRPARRRNDELSTCSGVAVQPPAQCAPGETVAAEFVVRGDGGPLLPAYLAVERHDGEQWVRVGTDGDWSTVVEWVGKPRTRARARWTVPADAAGTYRLAYLDVDKATPTAPFTVAIAE